MDYQGPAFHRIAFDELTQFSEAQYTYLFSRMRKRTDFPIKMGVRAASNPGGPGHGWVRQRFITREAELSVQSLGAYQPSPPGLIFWPTPDRAFVPARVADNPSLDIEDYVGRLRTQLSPVLRQRLLNGDWSVVEDAAIKLEWLRYYDMRGEILRPMNADGKLIDTVDCRTCSRFATIDTAGTSKQKAAEKKGKPASWSVCQIWDYWPQTQYLFLRHVWRDRVAWDGLKSAVQHVLTEWHPTRVLIENAHHGPPLAAELRSFHTELVSPAPSSLRGEEGKPGKLERATQLLNKLEKGEVFLPRYNNSWLPELENEWLTWTGLDDETSDQVDAAAYAARHNASYGWGGVVTLDFDPRVGFGRGPYRFGTWDLGWGWG